MGTPPNPESHRLVTPTEYISQWGPRPLRIHSHRRSALYTLNRIKMMIWILMNLKAVFPRQSGSKLKSQLKLVVWKSRRYYERQELLRKHEMDVRRFKEIEQGLVAERERLVQEIMSLKAWNTDLQPGNLELQDFHGRLEVDLSRVVEERNHVLRHHEVKLYTITQAFEILGGPEARKRAAAAKYGPVITSPTEYDHRPHKDKEDLDSWVNKIFAIDASNEGQLKNLVTDLARAGVSDFGNKIKNLEVFVNGISVEREKLQAEWTSRLSSPSRGEMQTPDAEKTSN